jgi:hypothetical protein
MVRGRSRVGSGRIATAAWLAAIALWCAPTAAAAAAPSPSGVVLGGVQHVYYVGADGQLRQLTRPGATWIDQDLAGFVSGAEPAASGSSPSVLLDRAGDQHIYYVGANGQIWQYVWDGSKWFIQDLAGFARSPQPVQPGGSPDAVDAGSDQHVWYVGAKRVWQWVWNGSSWTDRDLGGSPWMPPPPPPAATSGSTTVSAPPQPGRVHVVLTLSSRWVGARTRVRWIRALGAPPDRRFTVRCRGRGCPHGTRRRRRLSLRELSRAAFLAGDRLEITVSAPGLRPERFNVRFRFGRKPTGRVL